MEKIENDVITSLTDIQPNIYYKSYNGIHLSKITRFLQSVYGKKRLRIICTY